MWIFQAQRNLESHLRGKMNVWKFEKFDGRKGANNKEDYRAEQSVNIWWKNFKRLIKKLKKSKHYENNARFKNEI